MNFGLQRIDVKYLQCQAIVNITATNSKHKVSKYKTCLAVDDSACELQKVEPSATFHKCKWQCMDSGVCNTYVICTGQEVRTVIHDEIKGKLNSEDAC